jgi:alkylation response protein AidB-like acyl-CoA dehydrogenase
VDFELTDDQVALRDGIRSFLTGRAPLESLHPLELAGGAVDRTLWAELAGMGVFSLRNDGFGTADAVLAFAELGRALTPGPLVATHLAASLPGDLGTGAADGTRIVGLVEETEPVTVVEHLGSLDDLLVLSSTGIVRVDPTAVQAIAAERSLDALTPVSVVTGGLPNGEAVADAMTAADWRLDGMILTAALQLGICEATVELGSRYALERRQFDRPIGQFQAVKHMLADMLTRTEVARAAVYAAGVTRDGKGDGTALASAAGAAKILAGDGALFCAKTCIQVHGGMGFTWEVDAQRYWKRACVLDTNYGNGDLHAEAYATTI